MDISAVCPFLDCRAPIEIPRAVTTDPDRVRCGVLLGVDLAKVRDAVAAHLDADHPGWTATALTDQEDAYDAARITSLAEAKGVVLDGAHRVADAGNRITAARLRRLAHQLVDADTADQRGDRRVMVAVDPHPDGTWAMSVRDPDGRQLADDEPRPSLADTDGPLGEGRCSGCNALIKLLDLDEPTPLGDRRSWVADNGDTDHLVAGARSPHTPALGATATCGRCGHLVVATARGWVVHTDFGDRPCVGRDGHNPLARPPAPPAPTADEAAATIRGMAARAAAREVRCADCDHLLVHRAGDGTWVAAGMSTFEPGYLGCPNAVEGDETGRAAHRPCLCRAARQAQALAWDCPTHGRNERRLAGTRTFEAHRIPALINEVHADHVPTLCRDGVGTTARAQVLCSCGHETPWTSVATDAPPFTTAMSHWGDHLAAALTAALTSPEHTVHRLTYNYDQDKGTRWVCACGEQSPWAGSITGSMLDHVGVEPSTFEAYNDHQVDTEGTGWSCSTCAITRDGLPSTRAAFIEGLAHRVNAYIRS